MLMIKPEITGIATFFIVKDVPAALRFYRDHLGFDITFQGLGENDIFFGIVQRGAAMILLKEVGVDPAPNYTRDVKKGISRWEYWLAIRRRPEGPVDRHSQQGEEVTQNLLDLRIYFL